MDVSLTVEQQEWEAATARLAARYAVANADAIAEADHDLGWSAVLELGIPALRAPERSGVEAAGIESALAVERVAQHLCALPVAGQAVVAPELLRAAGATDALDAVLDGRLRLAPAFTADLADFARLGEPAVAFDAAGADHALVLVDAGGTNTSLAAVPLTSRPLNGLDLTRRLVPVSSDATPVALELGGEFGEDELTTARALTMTTLAADLLGVTAGAVADAVQYAKDRRQFGVPIGSFQAVQHLLADCAVALEGARSCVWHAAWAGDHEDFAAALLAARTAKAYCSAAGLRAVEATVQVFGGIAITWEHRSHLRLRRVHLDRQCFGDEGVQHRAIARARLGIGAVA